MNTIRLRQAVLADLDELSVLFDGYRQFYEQPSNVNHNESVLFIAHDGATPVGFAQLYPSFSSVSLGRIYIVNDLFVREAARGKGIGPRLLAASIAYAKTVGAIRLALSTALTNTRAQAVYAAEGWSRDDDFFYVHTLKA